MIFILCVMFGGLLLTWFLEDFPWEEELEMRRLIKQSRENERRRMRHRGTAYTQCGWRPTYDKRTRRHKAHYKTRSSLG